MRTSATALGIGLLLVGCGSQASTASPAPSDDAGDDAPAQDGTGTTSDDAGDATSAGDATNAGDAADATPIDASLPPANPLHVTPTLDATHAAKQTLGAAGGSITATAADGTTYTLAVPAGALLGPLAITLTPVTAIDGLPLSGGLVGAVDLQPNGLRLTSPATLTVAAASAPSGPAIAFGWHGQGDELHLEPTKGAAGQTSSISLMHFSGYGVATGTSADVATQESTHAPTAPEDASRQEEVVVDAAAMVGYLTGWGQSIVGDLQGTPSFEVIDAEYAQFLAWETEARSLGLDAQLTGTQLLIAQTLGQAVQRASTDVATQCWANKDVDQTLRLLRWYTWLLYKPEVAQYAPLDGIRKLLEACARFDLQFDTTVTQTNTKGQLSMQVHAQTPDPSGGPATPGFALKLYDASNPFHYSGSGQIVEQVLSWESDCPYTISTNPGTLLVTELDVDFNYVPQAPQHDAYMKTERIPSQEVVSYMCPMASTTQTTSTWASLYDGIHVIEAGNVADGPEGPKNYGNWTYDATTPAGVFCEKKWQRSEASTSISEDTTIRIVHRPLNPATGMP